MLQNEMAFKNLEKFDDEIVAMVDLKHVIKRIRNNILSSSGEEGAVRCLTCQTKSILWRHWQEAFEWDKSNNPEMKRIHNKSFQRKAAVYVLFAASKLVILNVSNLGFYGKSFHSTVLGSQNRPTLH